MAHLEEHLEAIQDPKAKDARIWRCISLWLETGEEAKALEAIRAMAFTEKRVRALISLSEHALAMGDVRQAQAFLEEGENVVGACPRVEDGFDGGRLLGLAYLKAGDEARARSCFLRARDLLPRIRIRANRQRDLAFHFERLGDAGEATQIEEAIEDPKVQVEMLTAKAWSARNEGHFGEAKALLEKALLIARSVRGPKALQRLELEVASHFREIGELDRAEDIVLAFQDPVERIRALAAFADRFFFETQARERFLARAKEELAQIPDGEVRRECHEILQRLEEPAECTVEEEALLSEVLRQMKS